MTSNYGFQNEYDFVNLFNDKYLYELDINSQKFLMILFGDIIDNNNKIQSWKNRMQQKADIFIKYNNHIKSISIKCGSNNSLHSEPIQEFKRYLEYLKIPYNEINKYVSYHYGYKRKDDGRIDFSQQLSSSEYKLSYQNEIDDFNKCINKTRIIIDMIDRFIIRGRNSDYDIDALISGTIDDYVWIMKYDLYDLILSKKCLEYSSPHIACLTLGPKKRCLYGDTNKKDRYLICVRWNNIKESIIEFHSINNCDGD